VTYAVSLLTDGAAKWAMGFAASLQGYLFDSWKEFNISFRQQIVSPVPALSTLSRVLEIKKGKRSVAEYEAKCLDLATQSGLGPMNAIQLFLKGLNSQYKDLAVLTLKPAESKKYVLALSIAHIITVFATRDTILTPNSVKTRTHPQQHKV
jgi:hypothetical protein